MFLKSSAADLLYVGMGQPSLGCISSRHLLKTFGKLNRNYVNCENLHNTSGTTCTVLLWMASCKMVVTTTCYDMMFQLLSMKPTICERETPFRVNQINYFVCSQG